MKDTIIEYTATAAPGIEFPSKTFILNDTNKILIISPCDLTEAVLIELKKSEKTLCFIAPNNFHNLHLGKMKEKFPNAQFYGPKRSAKQSGVELRPMSELKTEIIEVIFIDGCKPLSESCFYNTVTKKIYVTDLFFNMHHKMKFPMMLMMRLVGGYHRLNTTRSVRMSIKDKEAFKNSINQISELEVSEAIPCHGNSITGDEFNGWANKLITALN